MPQSYDDPHRCAAVATGTQFFFTAALGWYLFMGVDLFVAMVNPWIMSRRNRPLYHACVWTTALVSAWFVQFTHSDGLDSMEMCWIKRTTKAHQLNLRKWALLYFPVVVVYMFSLSVNHLAIRKLSRRQLDMSHRMKRRVVTHSLKHPLHCRSEAQWAKRAALGAATA